MAFIPQLRDWFFRGNAPENPRGKKINFLDNGQPDQDVMERLVASTIFKLERGDRAKQRQGAETLEQLAGWVEIATDEEVLNYFNGLDETPGSETTKVVHPQQLTEVAANTNEDDLYTLPGIDNNSNAPEFEDAQTIEFVKDVNETRRNKFLGRISPNLFSWLTNIVSNINLINTTIFGPGGPDNPGGGIGDGATYFNDQPMPEKVGGWDAGSTFDPAKTSKEMWDGLLYPFQVPEITLTLGTLFKTFEVGENLPTANTVNYTVSNVGNLQAPANGNLTSDIGSASFPVNPITLLAGGTFDVNFPGGTTETVATSREVTVASIDAKGNPVNGQGNILFRHKRYWGTHPGFVNPSDAAIIAANSEFSTTRQQVRNGFDGGGNYLFFAWPTSFGNPTFIVNGLTNTAWTKIRSAGAFINASGFSEPYDVWISNTPQASPLNIEVQ